MRGRVKWDSLPAISIIVIFFAASVLYSKGESRKGSPEVSRRRSVVESLSRL
jgi:hypothetical protein